MRRYVIFYARGGGRWGRLTPGVHSGLYDRPEVNAAIDFLRVNQAVEGVMVRLGDEVFNIMVTLNPNTSTTFDFKEASC